jgi:hypothetical protein
MGFFMAVSTTLALLEAVETAITSILTKGQQYRIGDRMYGRADLSELWQMRKELRSQYADESEGHARNYARFGDPI